VTCPQHTCGNQHNNQKPNFLDLPNVHLFVMLLPPQHLLFQRVLDIFWKEHHISHLNHYLCNRKWAPWVVINDIIVIIIIIIIHFLFLVVVMSFAGSFLWSSLFSHYFSFSSLLSPSSCLLYFHCSFCC